MKKALFAMSVLLTVCGIAASAAVPASKPLDPEKVIPKRELVFDQSEEEYPLVADPARFGTKLVEVLQDRYVAVLNLQYRVYRPGGESWSVHDPHPKERALSGRHGQDDGVWYFLRYSPRLDALANAVPKDRLPSNEILAMLAGPNVQVRMLKLTADDSSRRGIGGPGEFGVWTKAYELALIAPTAERAKELAHAAMVVYDYGFFPAYQDYVELSEHWASRVAKSRAELKADQDELAASEKELASLKSYEEITSESLASLVSQKQMNVVERAGVLARIAACEKILDQMKKSGRSSPTQAEKAETVKIAAEIELAGFDAKQSAIDDLVQKSRRRLELDQKLRSLRPTVKSADSWLQRYEARAQSYKAAIDEKMPFAKVEGKVLVRRIKWEQPKPAAKQ